MSFSARVQAARDKFPPAAAGRRPASTLKGVNALFGVSEPFPASYADPIADKCAQVRLFRDKPADILEPVWYAGIGVLHHCEDGYEKIHEWSEGHPEYTKESTDAKIRQTEAFGPTSCATFESRSPDACQGCPYRGKITTPLQLGRDTPATRGSANPIPDSGAVRAGNNKASAGRGNDKAIDFDGEGGFVSDGKGVSYNGEVIYPHPFEVVDLTKDEGTRFESLMVRQTLPMDGLLEFTFAASKLASPVDFARAMFDNSVALKGTKAFEALRQYVLHRRSELVREKKMVLSYSSMGWKDGTNYFVLGETAYHSDGAEERVGISRVVKDIMAGFATKGELQPWVEATAILDRPGMEAHALMFGIAPGAVLMKLAGLAGAFFCAKGAGRETSGTGKTSMGFFLLSMFGDPDTLRLGKSGTYTAKVIRTGTYNSLPVYLDEISNMEPLEASNFVYDMSQGRSKERSSQDGRELPTYSWNTLAAASSNASIIEKIASSKTNARAERLRILEVEFTRQEGFSAAVGKQLQKTIVKNHGHAGVAYIKYVVTHQEEVRRGLGECFEQLRKRANMPDEERLWLALVGCSLYGLQLMKNLGLAQINMPRVAQYAIEQIRLARASLGEGHKSAADILADYLHANFGSCLVVKSMPTGGGWAIDGGRKSFNEIHMRYESDTKLMWVDRAHFGKYLDKEKAERGTIIAELLRSQTLVKEQKRLSLGRGIPEVPPSQARVYRVDLEKADVDVVGWAEEMTITPSVSEPEKALLVAKRALVKTESARTDFLPSDDED